MTTDETRTDVAGQGFWRQAWGGAHGAWGWGRWALFLLVTIGLWWKPSSGLTDGLLVALGLTALVRPGRLWRAWGNPAGVAFLLLAAWAVGSTTWSLDASDVVRDSLKQLPLMLGVLGLGAWLCGHGGLVVRRAILASAAVITVRLGVEAMQLVGICGWRHLLELARYIDTSIFPDCGHTYLYTHPNVSSMLAGIAMLAFCAYLPSFWRARATARGRTAIVLSGLAILVNLGFIVMMCSRGPQMAFAAAVLLLPVFWLPGWKLRVAAVGLALVAGTILVTGAAKINPRFADTSTMRNANYRLAIWRFAGDRCILRPWTGYGFGKKAFHRMVYEHPDLPVLPILKTAQRIPIEFPHAHSYWLMLAAQGGYVALALGLLAWGGLALGLLLVLRRLPPVPLAARATPALLLTLLAMISIYGVADYPDSTLRFAQFLMMAAALACIADAADRPLDEKPLPASPGLASGGPDEA